MSPSTEADRSLEHLVFEIAKGVSGETGEAFFRSLVRYLASGLDAAYVFVGALQPDGKHIATLAVHGPEGEAPAIEYALKGTPCANVVQQKVCSYQQGVQQLFPQDKLLRMVGAGGYVGSPMVDSSGRCLGLICAVTRRPIENPRLAEALLKIFATRAERFPQPDDSDIASGAILELLKKVPVAGDATAYILSLFFNPFRR